MTFMTKFTVLIALASLPALGAPTFNKDVAPVVYGQCVECHREGEAGPFPLGSYDDVKKRAKQIVKVTASTFCGFAAFSVYETFVAV